MIAVPLCRLGGKHRATSFTHSYQREAGLHRAEQPSFIHHNRAVAGDGFWAWSAYMRARSGLRLLSADQIHFLRPADLAGPGGKLLSTQEQRVYFGVLIWQYVWECLQAPTMPTDEDYLNEVRRVQRIIGRGLPLAEPLDALYSASDDFCDPAGMPWAFRKQRKLFRAALREARAYALDLHRTTRASRPRKPGQRRPMPESSSHFQRQYSCLRFTYGRPDLPSYHRSNIVPQRPYAIASCSSTQPVIWLSPTKEDEE